METDSSDGQASDGQSSGSQSSGVGKKKEKIKHISFKLHGIKRTFDEHTGLGVFHLEMPYHLETTRFKKDTFPMLFLDVKHDDQIETLKIMKSLSHPNILQISFINQVKNEGVRVYVERYEGVLSTFLLKNKMPLVNPNTNLIPTESFQSIISGVIDGFNYLRENGEYHGNFSWDSTFFSNDRGNRITKLANFERKRSKSLSLKGKQAADCVSLGFGLAELSEYVKRKYAEPATTCCLIDDLASVLISVTKETVDIVMDSIKDRVFFWDENRRKSFLANEVPEAWGRKAFETSFKRSASFPAMPWTSELYDGNLAAMIAYRAENGIGKFREHDWKDFLGCISGMYTHRTELDVPRHTMPVDTAVLCAHPRICLDLKAAVDEPDPVS